MRLLERLTCLVDGSCRRYRSKYFSSTFRKLVKSSYFETYKIFETFGVKFQKNLVISNLRKLFENFGVKFQKVWLISKLKNCFRKNFEYFEAFENLERLTCVVDGSCRSFISKYFSKISKI